MTSRRPRVACLAPTRVVEAGSALAARFTFHHRQPDHVFRGVSMVSPALVQVARGRKVVRAAGEPRLEVEEGGFVWFPAGLAVDVRNVPRDGEYRAEALVLSQELVRWLPPEAARPGRQSVRQLSGAEHPGAVDAWRRCVEGLAQDAPQEVLRHRLLELVAWLGELGIAPFGATGGVRPRAKRLLAAAPGRAWRLGDVARELAMSEDTLQRHLARERTGFQELLGEVRMEHGLFLLWTTERPLALIAEEVGYLSASRFAARFRKRFGILPSALRRGGRAA